MFGIMVSVRVNYFRNSFSVLLRAQHYTMSTVRHSNHSLIIIWKQQKLITKSNFQYIAINTTTLMSLCMNVISTCQSKPLQNCYAPYFKCYIWPNLKDTKVSSDLEGVRSSVGSSKLFRHSAMCLLMWWTSHFFWLRLSCRLSTSSLWNTATPSEYLQTCGHVANQIYLYTTYLKLIQGSLQ